MAVTDLNKYARDLYAKVGKAVLLQHAVIEGGKWEPQPKMCHENVSIWCLDNPDYEPVRGWLYFDLPELSFVKFVAHSAVRTPQGELWDITPAPTYVSQDYPFIDGGLSEDDYANLVETQGHSEINYQLSG